MNATTTDSRISPPVALEDIIAVTQTYGDGSRGSVVDLANGVTLTLIGDGTGHDEKGNEYVEVCRGIGEPHEEDQNYYNEYEFLGYARAVDVLNA